MRWRKDSAARPGSMGKHLDGWLADANEPKERWKYFALVSAAGAAFAVLWAGCLWLFEKAIGKRPRWT